MAKTDFSPAAGAAALREYLAGVPEQRHLRLHRCYALTVPPGWEQREPRCVHDGHLIYIRGGRGVYRIDGEELPLQAGGVVFLHKGVWFAHDHDRRHPPRIAPMRFGLYDNRTGRPVDVPERPVGLALTPTDQGVFDLLCARLFAHYRAAGDRHTPVCSSLLHALLCETAAEAERLAAGASADPRIEAARQYLADNPARRTSLGELAELAGYAPDYFARKFLRQVGLSPKQYQLREAMRHARFLLSAGGLSVGDTAMALGYPDPYTFSRQFRRVTGMAPSLVRDRPAGD